MLILVATIALLAGTAAARADDGQRLVHVNGHAEIKVAPDEVIVSLGVETRDLDLAAAKNENDVRLTAVIAAVEALDVSREHIGTEYINIQPEYQYDRGERRLVDYLVRKTLVVTLRDIDKFESLLSDALEAGANYVHGVNFRTTELRKYRDQARAMALVAAKEKAEAMAKELGGTLGRVQSISEGHVAWRSWYGSGWGNRGGALMAQNVVQEGGGGSTEAPTTPGQISVDASVSVSFELAD
jgi:uncharacterized protein YggE